MAEVKAQLADTRELITSQKPRAPSDKAMQFTPSGAKARLSWV